MRHGQEMIITTLVAKLTSNVIC